MGKVFGICNVIGRMVTIFAPLVAEQPGAFSVPELTIIVTCIVGAIASSRLKIPKTIAKGNVLDTSIEF